MYLPLVESNLVIREGRTSNGRLLQWFNGSRCIELDVAIEVGYYVRLTGTFNSSSRLEIAYTAFAQSSNYTSYTLMPYLLNYTITYTRGHQF